MDIQFPTEKMSQPPRRVHRWPFLVLGLALLAFLVAPWPLWEKAWAIGYGICAQRPSHTYFAAGVPLPVEARMVGIFLGWLTTTAYFVLRGRGKSGQMASTPFMLVALALIGVMGIDGVNATLTDLRLPHLYEPQNPLRLFTGFGAGIAAGIVLLPAFNMTVWRSYRSCQPLSGWRDLGLLALLHVPLALLIMAQVGFLLYPLALGTVAGILGILTMINMVFATYIGRREYSSRNWLDASPLLLAGFVMTLIELGLLSWLKWWAITSTGMQMV